MPWSDSFSDGFDRLIADLEAAAPIAVGRGTHVIEGKAVSLAPIDTGHLRGSAEVTVTGEAFRVQGRVRFPGPYARRQHYELTWRHPKGGQALYLTTALYTEAARAVEAIAEAFRSVL
jgi:hypothetical protein